MIRRVTSGDIATSLSLKLISLKKKSFLDYTNGLIKVFRY